MIGFSVTHESLIHESHESLAYWHKCEEYEESDAQIWMRRELNEETIAVNFMRLLGIHLVMI